MSAYIVNREHISYLVLAAEAYGLNWSHGNKDHRIRRGDYDEMVRAGQMLWDENTRSVNARYRSNDEPLTFSERDLPLKAMTFPGVQVIKAAQCLRYQSCEHEGWEQSEACAFISALINSASYHIAGYDDAAWGAPEGFTLTSNLERIM